MKEKVGSQRKTGGEIQHATNTPVRIFSKENYKFISHTVSQLSILAARFKHCQTTKPSTPANSYVCLWHNTGWMRGDLIAGSDPPKPNKPSMGWEHRQSETHEELHQLRVGKRPEARSIWTFCCTAEWTKNDLKELQHTATTSWVQYMT